MSDFFDNDADLFSDDSIVTTKSPKRSKNREQKFFLPENSERNKKLWTTKTYRKRVVTGCRAAAIKQHQTMTDSMRKQRSKKTSATIKSKWQNPEYRAKMRDARLAGWAAKRKREGRTVSKTTIYLRERAAGLPNRRKKISTPYGIYDSVMDFYRKHNNFGTPKMIRKRLSDKTITDWKYI